MATKSKGPSGQNKSTSRRGSVWRPGLTKPGGVWKPGTGKPAPVKPSLGGSYGNGNLKPIPGPTRPGGIRPGSGWTNPFIPSPNKPGPNVPSPAQDPTLRPGQMKPGLRPGNLTQTIRPPRNGQGITQPLNPRPPRGIAVGEPNPSTPRPKQPIQSGPGPWQGRPKQTKPYPRNGGFPGSNDLREIARRRLQRGL